MMKPSNTTNTDAPSLRIGLVFDDSLDSTAGVSQYVRTLGAWLTKQGHWVSYLVGQTKMSDWQGGKVYSLSRNVSVNFNGNHMTIPTLNRNSRMISEVIKNNQFDVLHVTAPYSPFMAQKVIMRASNNTAVLGQFHILPATWMADAGVHLLKILDTRSFKRFDIMLAVSPAAADYAKRVFKVSVDVSPNVFDFKKFSSNKPKTGDAKRQIVFLGRLEERKGASELIKAFSALAKEDDLVSLVIAGDGPQRSDLETLIKNFKLESRIKLPGFIDEEKKAELLATAGVACFPSLYGESFGISLIEAMAASPGPVLGGDNDGYRTILGAQPLMLIDPTDTKAFADRLKLLLDDKELAAKLTGWQSHEVKKYDVELVGPQVVKLYRSAIAKRRDNH